MILRGSGRLIRRIIEDLENVYLPYKNEKTGQNIGMLQLMPREIKSYEVVFPATHKKEIKKLIERIVLSHNTSTGGVGIHWGPWKKDKYKPTGEEIL
jgi:hypothetical protein